jgi:hypothetical protein
MTQTELTVWVPLAAALGGALIGASASIITVYLQARISDRRARAQAVLSVALEHYKNKQELAKLSGQPFTDLPLVTYVHYHAELLKLIEDGALNADTLEALERANVELVVAIAEMDETVRGQAHTMLEQLKAKRRAKASDG